MWQKVRWTDFQCLTLTAALPHAPGLSICSLGAKLSYNPSGFFCTNVLLSLVNSYLPFKNAAHPIYLWEGPHGSSRQNLASQLLILFFIVCLAVSSPQPENSNLKIDLCFLLRPLLFSKGCVQLSLINLNCNVSGFYQILSRRVRDIFEMFSSHKWQMTVIVACGSILLQFGILQPLLPTCAGQHFFLQPLSEALQIVFCVEPDRKYFRFNRPVSLCDMFFCLLLYFLEK